MEQGTSHIILNEIDAVNLMCLECAGGEITNVKNCHCDGRYGSKKCFLFDIRVVADMSALKELFFVGNKRNGKEFLVISESFLRKISRNP